MTLRFDWTTEELLQLYHLPLIELVAKAHAIHLQNHKLGEIQVNQLISIKTGGCPEDCKYCAQSSYYKTKVKATPMMQCEDVLEEAKKAIDRGASRICLGAAWREARDSPQFEEVLKMIKGICDLGAEVCCTLGLLKEPQAKKLKAAGLYAYNHNLDSSEKFYPTIITTRTYQDRLQTLQTVRKAGLTVCCGAIVGMGETLLDRLELIQTLSNQNPHPESFPINQLTQNPGTPLENLPDLSIWEIIPLVAIARIALPKTMVRLSCGRMKMNCESHLLCFLAGANSLFMGEKLLTVQNAPIDRDQAMFTLLGLTKQKAYAKGRNDFSP